MRRGPSKIDRRGPSKINGRGPSGFTRRKLQEARRRTRRLLMLLGFLIGLFMGWYLLLILASRSLLGT